MFSKYRQPDTYISKQSIIACLTTLGYCFTCHFASIKLAKVALNWDKQACEIVRASNLNAISLSFVCKIASVIRTMKIWNVHRRISSVARHLKVGGQSKIEANVPTKYSWCTDKKSWDKANFGFIIHDFMELLLKMGMKWLYIKTYFIWCANVFDSGVARILVRRRP